MFSKGDRVIYNGPNAEYHGVIGTVRDAWNVGAWNYEYSPYYVVSWDDVSMFHIVAVSHKVINLYLPEPDWIL